MAVPLRERLGALQERDFRLLFAVAVFLGATAAIAAIPSVRSIRASKANR